MSQGKGIARPHGTRGFIFEDSMGEYSVAVDEVSEVERGVQITVERSAFQRRFDRAVGQAMNQAHIKGFRPGKAPRNLVEKFYGTGIRADIIEEFWRDAFDSVVKERELKVFGISNFQVEGAENASEDLKIIAGLALHPEPKIDNYSGLEFEVEIEPYSEELLEKELKDLQRRLAEPEPVTDREIVADGDFARVTFEVFKDGEEAPVFKSDDAYIEVGSGRSPKELEEGIIGQKIGETRDVKVTFAADHHDKSLAGKETIHRVVVKEINRLKLPEMDDAFAALTGLAETFKDLKDMVEKNVRRSLEARNRNARLEGFVKAVSEVNPFPVPSLMVDEEVRELLFDAGLLNRENEQHRRLAMGGFRDVFGAQAELRLRKRLILGTLIEKEKTEVTDDELSKWIDERAEEYSVDRVTAEKSLGFPRQADRLKQLVAEEKGLTSLLSKSKIKEKTAEKKA